MTSNKTTTDLGVEAEHISSGLPSSEADVHHPTGWLHWKLILYSMITARLAVYIELLSISNIC